MSLAPKKWIRRAYQKVALVAARKTRSMVLFWARQCRKSTTLGDIAFDEMSRQSGRNVIAASASLLVGSELVSKTMSSAEQAALVTREASALQSAAQNSTAESGLQIKVANSDTGKIYERLSASDFTDLYRTSRLEMRLYHDKTAYSRLLVIAPNPATARGWTGTVVRDEAGFTHANLERDLQIAVKPIMDTDPSFKLIYASNLPRDDRHPFFEMTLPEPGTEFPVNGDGNFYRGQNGILIHRVALVDAYAAGHVLYDTREGKPLTYEQFCKDPANRLGLDESYRLIHKFGGAAAIDLFALTTAQRRGIGQCGFFFVENDSDFYAALKFLSANLKNGAVGIGCDTATTTGDTSNPTSVTVTEKRGTEFVEVAVMIWKERDPKIARERLRQIITAVRMRKDGGAARRFCIDATNEQYFARETARELGALAPFELVDARNTVAPAPAGYQRDPNYKTWLGDLYATAVNDNRVTVPNDEYFKDDHRLVVKSAGTYVCEPQVDGKHGDTFDSGKLALYALNSSNGAITAEIVKQIRIGG
ncbi:MAG TPA: hypothetical protein VHG89_03835, partial [Verrucomicrobiae bacterium]|nr:hypothetical protein [Verrucomicrobiae bacterium]